LGGHIDACDECGNLTIIYNSVNIALNVRGINERLIQARMTELLPVPYFHVVLPCQLVLMAIHQPKIVYDTLFEATWETLQQFGKTRKYKWE
jgi:hypothetical protein